MQTRSYQSHVDWLKYMAGIVVGAVALYGFYCLLNRAVTNNEKEECYKWQRLGVGLEGYYITQWQADQCSVQGITIDAPVK